MFLKTLLAMFLVQSPQGGDELSWINRDLDHRDITAGLGRLTPSESEWRIKYCMNGSGRCLDHLVFTAVSNQSSVFGNDLGLRMAFAELNDWARPKILSGKKLSSAEIGEAQLRINTVIKKYSELKEEALGRGDSWTDKRSVEALRQAIGTIPYAGTVTEGLFAGGFAMGDLRDDGYDQLFAQYRFARAADSLRNKDVFGEYYLLADKDDGLASAGDLAMVAAGGVSSRESPDDLLDKHPVVAALLNTRYLKDQAHNTRDGLQLLIRRVTEAHDGQSKDGREIKGLLKDLAGSIDDQSKKLNKLLAENEHDRRQKQKDEEQGQKDKESRDKINDYQAGLKIFYSLGSLVKDPEAQKFVNDATVVGKLALTIYAAKLNPDHLSNMVLTGNVVEAAAAVLGLFVGSGPTPDQMILQQLGEIRKDLNEIRGTILKGFEATFKQLGAIYQSIDQGFEAVLRNQKITLDMLMGIKTQLQDVERHVGRLNWSLNERFTALAKRVQAYNNLACFDVPRFTTGTPSEVDFNRAVARLASEGSEDATDVIATNFSDADMRFVNHRGSDAKTTRPFELEKIKSELTSIIPEAEINYLAGVGVVHLGVSAFPKSNEAVARKIPSIPGWLEGASRFVYLLETYPQYRGGVRSSAFEALVNSGNDIQGAIREFQSQTFMEKLLGAIDREQDALAESLKELEKAILTKKDLAEFIPQFWNGLPNQTERDPVIPKIQAADLSTSKDLPVSYKAKDLPGGLRVAIRLGVGPVEWKAEYVPGNLFPALPSVVPKFLRDGVSNLGSVPGGWWSLDKKLVRAGVRDKGGSHIDTYSAHAILKISNALKLGGHTALVATHTSKDKLLVGNAYAKYPRRLGLGVIGAEPAQPPVWDYSLLRTRPDVLEQVWSDGVYDLRKTFAIHYDIDPWIFNESQKIWTTLHQGVRETLASALVGGENPDYTAEMQAVRFRVNRLESLYAYALAIVPLAFEGVVTHDDSLFEALLTTAGSTNGTDLADLLSQVNEVSPDGRSAATQVRDTLRSRHEALKKAWAAAVTRATGSKSTLGAVDLLVSRLEVERGKNGQLKK